MTLSDDLVLYIKLVWLIKATTDYPGHVLQYNSLYAMQAQQSA